MHVDERKSCPVRFDRHAPDYRERFVSITRELQDKCPIAWTETYGGHWVASGHQQVFDLARSAEYLSNDHDSEGKRRGYQGISIPQLSPVQAGFLEMDPPQQREYRQALNPYLSPAAVARWQPLVSDLTRACLDEVIESGRIDFVDELANVVPAVLTLAMMGLPLADWEIYCEPAHASVYTPPDSPAMAGVMDGIQRTIAELNEGVAACRRQPRPGMVDALLQAEIAGARLPDQDIVGALYLVIGGGFDTTTALTAHALEWLGQNPDQRRRLSDQREELLNPATEEFLRFFTPAPGDARTISQDCVVADTRFQEGERLWLSWAMANRDPSVFPDPDTIHLDRKFNRHSSFGLGIHRCIGSNMARMTFKTMLTQVLDRMPGYVCDQAGTVHYDTVGVINGMKHLPATFEPGARLGDGVEATIARWQRRCDDEGLAAPIVRAEQVRQR